MGPEGLLRIAVAVAIAVSFFSFESNESDESEPVQSLAVTCGPASVLRVPVDDQHLV